MACVLLIGCAGVFIGCVLPPPPFKKAEPVASLVVDYSALDPLTAGTLVLERKPEEQLSFKVAQALEIPDDTELNYYWFVDYTVGSQEFITGDPFQLNGCAAALIGPDPDTVTVEVLITQGTLIFNPEKADPRTTLGGEAIQKIVWAIKVTGVGGPTICESGNVGPIE